MDDVIKDFLAAHGITYVLHTHPAVFTVEEAKLHCGHIPGLACKNIFLKDDAGRFHLVCLPDHKRLDMGGFRKGIGARKTRFGTPAELHAHLRLTPGSVSPFGLIHDTGREVMVHVDREVWDAPVVTFHPNINTETLELSQAEFRKLFAGTGHVPHILD